MVLNRVVVTGAGMVVTGVVVACRAAVLVRKRVGWQIKTRGGKGLLLARASTG